MYSMQQVYAAMGCVCFTFLLPTSYSRQYWLTLQKRTIIEERPYQHQFREIDSRSPIFVLFWVVLMFSTAAENHFSHQQSVKLKRSKEEIGIGSWQYISCWHAYVNRTAFFSSASNLLSATVNRWKIQEQMRPWTLYSYQRQMISSSLFFVLPLMRLQANVLKCNKILVAKRLSQT